MAAEWHEPATDTSNPSVATDSPALAVRSTVTETGIEWTLFDASRSAADRQTHWLTASDEVVVEVAAWR